jgi:hypothetical protein
MDRVLISCFLSDCEFARYYVDRAHVADGKSPGRAGAVDFGVERAS